MNKGFFLSLSALVFLVFAVSSVTQHLSAIRENEIFYADLMNLLSYQTVFSNFNNESVSATLGATGKFALYKMANYTTYNPIKPAGADDMDNVMAVFQSLINNGTTDPDMFENSGDRLTYSGAEMNYTLNNFAALLNESLAPIGYSMNELRFNNTRIAMASPHSVMVTADIIINVSDALGRSEYRVVYKDLGANVSIEGLPDPMLNRYLYEEGISQNEKQNFSWFMFRHNSGGSVIDGFSSATGSIRFSTGTAGQGWFYGPLISFDRANRSTPDTPELYILYGNLSDILAMENWTRYGAYIINNSIIENDNQGCGAGKEDEDPATVFNPVVYSAACVASENPEGTHTTKPFAVLPGFNRGTVTGDPDFEYYVDDQVSQTGDNPTIAAYFNTGKDQYHTSATGKRMSEISLYGIESIRDQLICAYYYKSVNGPNFFQRMFRDAYSRKDANGLTTILVEKEFLGPNSDYKGWSSVDFEFVAKYKGSSGAPSQSNLYVIRGMPGCKTREMCATGTVIRRVIGSKTVMVDEFALPGYLYCGLNDALCTGVE